MWPTLYYGKFSLGYKYSSEKMKQNDPNSNSDKQTTSLIISNQYPLATNWNFVTTYNQNNITYKTIDPTFGIKREDTYDMLEAGVSFDMTKTCSISSTIKQIINNSNISIYTYDKYIATITFRKSF
jgi:predicted porin